MKFISLFAGVGGFDLALERLGHTCVYANEWDKYAAQTYEKNFKRKPDTRSITDVDIHEIPDHSLLTGGFPCQSFSIAGKRGGFSDTRGTMFFEIARILKYKRPTYLLLENVKGLLSHDDGRTFQTIMRTLDELGYDTQWQVLNSKNFGVPQNRERVFIIGHFRGTSRPKVFPIGKMEETTEKGLKKELQHVAGTLRARDYASWRGQFLQVDKADLQRQGNFSNSNNEIRRIPYSDDSRIRFLTPVEYERLQGFPDNWTAGVSDTQRYKQMGNAVTVNVVYEVAKRLLD